MPAKKTQSKKPKTAGKSKPKKATSKVDTRVRLQRVMAAAGIASRRECELMIEEGRVEVDGQIVTRLGMKVDPYEQEIYVDAQELVLQQPEYFILNKPPGILSTSKDPSGRPRVIDLIRTEKRVYNVGRLDKSSEGLILVTNDGDLANKLTHPSYGIEKKYHVQVAGIPAPRELKKLEEGVRLAEGFAKATSAKFLKKAKNGCWLEIVLAEGRNREIRRMLALIGHKVRTLRRVSIGPLRLGDLPLGAHRRLTQRELKALQTATSGEPKRPRRKSRPKSANRKTGRAFAGRKESKTSKTSDSKPGSRTTKKRSAKGGSAQSKNAGKSPSKRGAGRNSTSPSRKSKASKPKRRSSKKR